MSRFVDTSPSRAALRHVPGAGGFVVGVGVAAWLAGWSAEEVDAALVMAGVPLAMTPVTFALAVGVIAGAVIWAALYLICGTGGWVERRRRGALPKRAPLSYADLGPPPPREQPLPADLDQPLSAFDPDAIGYQRR